MSTKKILGLDLGTNSIGWALITETTGKKEILGMGSRIIPLTTDDKNEFSQGNKISKNQKRTTNRTQRRGYDRYQQRRKNLTKILLSENMFDASLFKLSPLELWGLRARSVNEKVELSELGRIFYHLNQKRGYKSSRSDANVDKKDTDYVAEVKSRYEELKELGLTIGQKFYTELLQDQYYRIKQQVYPREAYVQEFEMICKQQQKHYPNIITDSFIIQLREEIIYYQRNLKSQKGLVSVCDFEGFIKQNKNAKEVFVGPKVAPKSSPLFQVCKIWESINSISIKDRRGDIFEIPSSKKQLIFNFLDNNERLTASKLFDIIGIKKADGYYTNKQIERGIQGNLTKSQILNLIKDLNFDLDLLQFELKTKTLDREAFLIDYRTGEVLTSTQYRIVEVDIENQPLYRLWHTIYSISDIDKCADILMRNFGIEQGVAKRLANIDFTRQGYGNKSVKAMRKILPYLMEGFVYSQACSFAGYNHSESRTKDQNAQRVLLKRLPQLQKNSLRQPVVEKILNQMINVVNSIIEKYGPPDEIRVELARELKQSKEERNATYSSLSMRERENEKIRKRITEEYNLRATRNNVVKWRLFHEISNDESKLNANCIYCGKNLGIVDTLRGSNIEVEHIIPKSLLFDDSQSNKTLSHRICNETKGNRTAYDYMASKPDYEFEAYLQRVDELYKNRIIGKGKRDKLLMSESKIPKDFIDRQLRQTQYISRKSREILESICTNVWSTSGTVTEYLRRIWGWDEVLMNLQIPKYRELGLIEWKEWETNDGQKHKREVIKDWSKRDDHRHHAIDALVISCTQQGFIQRINNLSSKGNKEEMYNIVGKSKNGSLLENYFVKQRPFSTREVEDKASEILVSFKSGKKVATTGTRKVKKGGKKQVVQSGIIVPRGPLSEEFVYGRIKVIEKNLKTGEIVKRKLSYLFEHPDLIVKNDVRQMVKIRLDQYQNDFKKALASLKKEPIYLNEEKTIILEDAICYKNEYVIKYKVQDLKFNDVPYIIDEKVREIVRTRLERFGNKEKEAFKSPIYQNEKKKIQIRTVRMFTGLSSVEPVKKDEAGNAIGFVKPGNNHHIAFYIDSSGQKVEHICTFWHAVERKRYNLPVVIKDVKEIWDRILQRKEDYPKSLLDKLPKDNWTFVESLQQNEMVILGLDKEAIHEAIRNNDYRLLSQYLYLTWSISESDYWFRLHTETKNSELKSLQGAKEAKRYYRFKSIGALDKLTPTKIKVSNLGEISTLQEGF